MNFLGRWWIYLVCALLAAPLGSLLIMAASSGMAGQGTLLHLATTVMPGLLGQTALLCLGVLVLTLTMGVLPAWWVCTLEFPGRRWVEWGLFLPLAVPAYVVAYAYTDALQFSGPLQTQWRAWGFSSRLPEVRSLPGAVLVLSFVLYPYVYLLARSAFAERNPSLVEAARTMGLNGWQAFTRVSLPVARPAIAAGVALVMMETLSEFGALSFFGVQTFTTAIYRAWLNFGDRGSASILALILLVVMFTGLMIEQRARGRAGYVTTTGRSGTARRRQLHGLKASLVLVFSGLPLLLGFVAPVGFLLRLLWVERQAHGLHLDWGRFAGWAMNSSLLAVVTALMCVVLALMIAQAKRVDRSALVQGLHRAVSLGYGVPGAILAIAILLTLATWDQALMTGLGLQRPLFAGTVIALLYAYAVRFTSAALQSVDAGLSRITPSIDDSARTLGCTPWQLRYRLHWPMLRGSLATGALLVMVDVMKELPATLVLRPFDFDTLAVVSYHLAMDERLAELALPSLAIVAVALVPIWLLIRQQRMVGG